MARPLRPLVAGGVYHVFSRGLAKREIFVDDDDREALLDEIERVARRFGWLVLDWCLMPNHFHLIVKTSEPNLPRGMQTLKTSYAQVFNKRHGRVDSVFGGRYGAILIQQDRYLKSVFRYVAVNPVRAKLCTVPEAYHWGGYPALVGRAPARPFHAVGDALAFFEDPADYAVVVGSEPGLEYLASGVVFGDEHFKRHHLPSVRPSTEIPERHWGEGRPPVAEVMALTPGTAGIAVAYRTYGYRLGDIADALGIHVSTVSRRLRAHEALENKI